MMRESEAIRFHKENRKLMLLGFIQRKVSECDYVLYSREKAEAIRFHTE